MNELKNPFSPGAGSPPPELVGREEVLEAARILFGRTLLQRSERSLVMVGLRGVGKTVLLNRMKSMAQEQGYKTILMEVQEGHSFSSALVPNLKSILSELNPSAQAGEQVRRGLLALRNFIGTLKLRYGDFGIDLEPLPGIADTGDITLDLPQVITAIATAAQEAHSGIALLIDEMQLLSQAEFNALILAMHQLQQQQLPFVLIGAGLPTIPRLAGEAKSYAERLFAYPVIGQLSQDETAAALGRPTEREGVVFTYKAVREIYRMTNGYPYFLQEWGYQLWNLAPEGTTAITEQDVQTASARVMTRLDENFFRVRYDRLTEGEKRFMRAMAAVGDNGCSIADLAKEMGVKSQALSPVRSALIKKGMIYSPRHGILEYSVPLFGEFMRRTIP